MSSGEFVRSYEACPANVASPGTALGAAGAKGDLLERLVCVVATAATSQVQIKDGSATAIEVLPAIVGGGVGTYNIMLNLTSQVGAWQVITGAGVAVIAIGSFT